MHVHQNWYSDPLAATNFEGKNGSLRSGWRNRLRERSRCKLSPVKEFAWTTFIFLFFLQQHVFSFLFKHTRDAICIKFFFASRVKSHLGRWVRFFCEVKSEPFFVSCFNNIIDRWPKHASQPILELHKKILVYSLLDTCVQVPSCSPASEHSFYTLVAS
jgi:hypothetical protein